MSAATVDYLDPATHVPITEGAPIYTAAAVAVDLLWVFAWRRALAETSTVPRPRDARGRLVKAER